MVPSFYHIVRMSPVLRHLEPDPAALVGRLPTASSGETTMIRAALSLIPASWLRQDGIEPEPFRLEDIGGLDANNTRALLEAIAIQAGHAEVLGQEL